ncbi:unnamed protein product [Sphenostylis stenocarpa]|uniref:Uncharacterized protein n=1 Tax=Sphenostylis stenocarpa TaxID=92480 RepID=A0AA86SDY2_9FABA|nr:unnamed protein product [Sphenostylis stenocarpa]
MSATVTLTLNLFPTSSIVSSSYLSPHSYSFNHIPNPNFNAFFSFSLSLSLFQHRRLGICKKPSPKPFSSRRTWLYGHMNRDRDTYSPNNELEKGLALFGSDEELATQIPTQAQSVVEGSGSIRVSEFKPVPDVDYLQELLAIQQQGPRAIGFFGTRNMGFMHQELIEILSYAMVITKNHIYTSGASGTNAAVIRGALRAEKPELLTVILPQSLSKQPPESQELLSKVKNVIEKPHNDHLPLIEASRLCNMDIISHVQQVICFAFHDSRLLMETCQEAKNLRKIVTLFYLD